MIAVVDDYPDAASALVRILQRSGLEATGFESFVDLLTMLASGAPMPSLIILDLHLPVMNGIDCLKELQRNPQWREIPVVLYTADNSNPLLAQARQFGARDVIPKGTMEWKDFVARLRRHQQPNAPATDTPSQSPA